MNMKYTTRMKTVAVVLSCLLTLGVWLHASPAAAVGPKTFPTPDAAANALIDAAEKFDEATLDEILGPSGKEIVHTGEPARDREIAKQFAEQARMKMKVSVANSKNRAFVIIGTDGWPFPVPIVK